MVTSLPSSNPVQGYGNSLDRKVFGSSDDAEEASDGEYVVVTGYPDRYPQKGSKSLVS